MCLKITTWSLDPLSAYTVVEHTVILIKIMFVSVDDLASPIEFKFLTSF